MFHKFLNPEYGGLRSIETLVRTCQTTRYHDPEPLLTWQSEIVLNIEIQKNAFQKYVYPMFTSLFVSGKCIAQEPNINLVVLQLIWYSKEL
jgi:hypothetical protein